MTSLIGRGVGMVASALGLRAEANPLDDRYYSDYWTSNGGSFGPSLSGVNVSQDNALRVAVFYRALIVRAQSFAQLPLGVYQRTATERKEIPDHPLAMAFDRPNPFQGTFEWLQDTELDRLMWGRAYNQIVVSGDGLQFIPLDVHRMREITKEGDAVRTYEFTRKSGEKVRMVGDRDVWHLKAPFGRGLVDLARNTLGLAISAEAHSSVFMRRGVKSAVVLQHPGKLRPEIAAAMGANFNVAYGGGEGYGKVPVLWEDMKVQTVSIDHQKAQFLELDLATQERIATFCGVAPHMVGLIDKQTSWGAGVEEQSINFHRLSQKPACRYFQQDAGRVFLDSGRGSNGKYVRFDTSEWLRGRALEQAQINKIYIDCHVKTPNEVRKDLDLDPIEGGDEFPAVPGAQLGTEAPEKPGEEPPAKPKVVKASIVESEPVTIDHPRLKQLAAWVASELLNAEARDMAEIAKTTATDSAKWAQALSTYYGRRADTVAQSLSITKDEARAYCKEQARVATEGGAKVLESWTRDHAGRVIALAMGTTTTTGKE